MLDSWLLNDLIDRLSDGIITWCAILLRRSAMDVGVGELSHSNNLFRINEDLAGF